MKTLEQQIHSELAGMTLNAYAATKGYQSPEAVPEDEREAACKLMADATAAPWMKLQALGLAAAAAAIREFAERARRLGHLEISDSALEALAQPIPLYVFERCQVEIGDISDAGGDGFHLGIKMSAAGGGTKQ